MTAAVRAAGEHKAARLGREVEKRQHDPPGGGADTPAPTLAPHGAPGDKSRGRLAIGFGPPALLLLLLAVVVGLGFRYEITLQDIVELQQRFHGFLANHRLLALLAFVLVYILVGAFCLPGSPILTAMGGLMFGWLAGGLATIIGATIGATILFLIARTTLGPTLAENAGPWLVKLRQGFARNALSYLLFVRLVPAFPFWFVNVAAAILGVPLKTFVAGTFFGIIPATFTFAMAGAGLDRAVAEHAACVAQKGAANCSLTLLTWELVVALVLLGLLALLPVAVKKWRRMHARAE
jgi:uncharacterized membrane protein YdjX (TVP38/TMEM64 family)